MQASRYTRTFSVLPLINHIYSNAKYYAIGLLLLIPTVSIARQERALVTFPPESLLNNDPTSLTPLGRFVTEVCTTAEPFVTVNRASGFSQTITASGFQAEICLEDAHSKECEQAKTLPFLSQEVLVRVVMSKQLGDYLTRQQRSSLQNRADTIFMEMQQSYSSDKLKKMTEIFNNYLNRIQLLILLKVQFDKIKETPYGTCDAHRAHNGYQILKMALQLGRNINLKAISYRYTAEWGHATLFVDSDIPEGTYANTQEITQILELFAVDKGYVCDSWNKGYLAPLNELRNALYTTANLKISITQLSLDFPTNVLDLRLAALINSELAQLGLRNMESKPYMGLFRKKTTQVKSSEKFDNKQTHRTP